MRTVDLLGGAEVLSENECWDILAGEEVGRLAVVAKGKPDIFPVNFDSDGRAIVIHSNVGHKLLSASGTEVAFEVDRIDLVSKLACSVIVHGPATVETSDDPGSAWAGPKEFQIRIDPLRVTGRRVFFRPTV
jgi:nitroimidazol reductase NimA-like FMN-containing flavoprotein (pyridoxamine 5'-phosphate oxidase superfamily)